MFESRRRSKKPWIFILLILAVFVGANLIGYFMAKDQIPFNLEPRRLPDGGALPFSREFQVNLPSFLVKVPFEVERYTLSEVHPDELNLIYRNLAGDEKMEVRIFDASIAAEQIGRFPQNLLLRNGMSGRLIYEVFSEGIGGDGISMNPIMAVREGLLARLRGEFHEIAKGVKITRVSLVGTPQTGQVWRFYLPPDGKGGLIAGAVYQEKKYADIRIRFTGKTPDIGSVVGSFTDSIIFRNGDIKLNGKMADRCVGNSKKVPQPYWETPCIQAYLVAQFISDRQASLVGRRLYHEYLAADSKDGIRDLYDQLTYEFHEGEDAEALKEKIEKENPWLIETDKDEDQ